MYAGSGRLHLVLLPGMGCSPALWRDVIPRIRHEVPGLEISTPTLDAPALDDSVEILLRELPPQFAVAGLSLGGIVAMALARRAPHRVAGLCLLSTNPRSPTRNQLDGWAAARGRLASGEHAPSLQRDLLPVLLSANHHKRLRDRVVAMAEDVGDEVLDAQLALQATRIDERSGLAQFHGPAEVIAAEGDALCPVAWHTEMASILPRGTLTRIQGAAHLSTLEAPGEVAAAMASWIMRVRSHHPTPRCDQNRSTARLESRCP